MISANADSWSGVQEDEDIDKLLVGRLVMVMRRGRATAASVPSDAQLLGSIGQMLYRRLSPFFSSLQFLSSSKFSVQGKF
jgi:hypothetical protein